MTTPSAPQTAFGLAPDVYEPHRRDLEFLELPDGRVLRDACIWPGFMQQVLNVDPEQIWHMLREFPTWPANRPIPFRPDGSDVHWVGGRHPALNFRGNAIRRSKIWCQSGYSEGLRKYRYSGWQWKVAYATHDVQQVAPVAEIAGKLNAHMEVPINHWIVTAYENERDCIGLHSDKMENFAPNSCFVVLKLGAPRQFDFCLATGGNDNPFFSRVLEAGTAIFCRANSADGSDANTLIKHGVPPMARPCGPSGSIVGRAIETVIPWPQVHEEIRQSLSSRAT